MINTKTLLDNFASLSVRVNGLIVPGRSIESTLARHAFSLVVNNDHEIYKISLVGSATPVLFKGRHILLCTNHQLEGVDPQQVSMLMDDGSLVVTSNGFRSYAVSDETDAYDIAAFDFSDAVAAHPELKRRFFRFDHVPPDALNVNILAVLVAGYPTDDQKYDLEELNHIGLARRHVVCAPHEQPTDAAVLTLRAHTPLTKDPDGMSGGPAFAIQLVDGQPSAYLAGMVVRGGLEYFHIIKSGFVMAFLDSVYGQH